MSTEGGNSMPTITHVLRRPRARLLRAFRVLTLLSAVSLVACSSEASPATPTALSVTPTTVAPTTSSSSSTLPEDETNQDLLAWQVDLKPVSRLAAGRGSVAFLEAASEDDLELVGLDAQDGSELWRVPAEVPATPRGVNLSVRWVDGYFVTFTAAVGVDLSTAPGSAVPSVIDETSGELVWSGPVVQATSGLSSCDAGVCFMGVSTSGTGGSSAFELHNVGPDASLDERPIEGGDGLMAISSDTLIAGGEAVQALAYRDPATGMILWQRQVRDIFPDRPVDVNRGYSTEVLEDEGLMLVQFGRRLDLGEDLLDVDLSKRSVAAVDLSSGATLWLVDGVEFGCLATLPSLPSASHVWCRDSGHRFFAKNAAGDDYSFDHQTPLSSTVEVFDPKTGTVLGQMPLELPSDYSEESAADLPDFELAIVDQSLVQPGNGARPAIDLFTGDVTTVDPLSTVWCGVSVPLFTFRGSDRVAPDQHRPCLAGDHSEVSSMPSPSDTVGVVVDGNFVWSDGSAVFAVACVEAGGCPSS